MHEQAVLPVSLDLKSLEKVSPSHYTRLKKCPLQEVWNAAHQPVLLPISPTARVGTVIHQLLESAGRGLLNKGEKEAAGAEWERLVQIQEVQMKASWLERSMVPLCNAISDFEVRKIRAINKASEVAREAGKQILGKGKRYGSTFEVWVDSDDGKVGGFIDQVAATKEGIILRDYKTGCLKKEQRECFGPDVWEYYQAQLKLYAVLYKKKYGLWPLRLEVEFLTGEIREISFAEEECVQILNSALASLGEVNGILSDDSLTRMQKEELLAKPAPLTCRFCLFRPACSKYHTYRDIHDSPDWPFDAWGLVNEVKKLRNGRLLLSLEIENRKYKNARIRGLDPIKDRHPALLYIEFGSKIYVYNLSGNSDSGSFFQGPITTIYRQR